MSGIIGGQNLWGSKSGVIGQTELDYEEGTWTATGGVVNGVTMIVTAGSTSGEYTKIGQQVFLWGYVTFGDHASDGNNTYTASLPYTPKSGTYAYGKIGYNGSADSTLDGMFVEIRNGEAFLRYGKDIANNAGANLGRDDSNQHYFAFSISYIVA